MHEKQCDRASFEWFCECVSLTTQWSFTNIQKFGVSKLFLQHGCIKLNKSDRKDIDKMYRYFK